MLVLLYSDNIVSNNKYVLFVKKQHPSFFLL